MVSLKLIGQSESKFLEYNDNSIFYQDSAFPTQEAFLAPGLVSQLFLFEGPSAFERFDDNADCVAGSGR